MHSIRNDILFYMFELSISVNVYDERINDLILLSELYISSTVLQMGKQHTTINSLNCSEIDVNEEKDLSARVLVFF